MEEHEEVKEAWEVDLLGCRLSPMQTILRSPSWGMLAFLWTPVRRARFAENEYAVCFGGFSWSVVGVNVPCWCGLGLGG